MGIWVKIPGMNMSALKQTPAGCENQNKGNGCMGRKSLQLGSLFALALFSAPLLAMPFAPIEPVSYALGGTGVSSASSSNAGFFNPAMLAVNAGEKAELLPTAVLGSRYFDRQNVLDSVYSYQGVGVEPSYDEALADFNAGNYVADDPAQSRALIAAAAGGIRSRFPVMADKTMQQEYMMALVVAIPHDKFNMSFSLSRKMLGGALVDIAENDLTELDRMVEEAGNGELLSSEFAIDPDTGVSSGLFGSADFASRFRGRGLSTTEFGLSVAGNHTVAGHDIAIGITPKLILATSFDYAKSIGSADFETDLGRKNNFAFDVDLGAAKSYGNGWRAGVAIKNLIGQKYKTRLGNKIKVRPQVRVGVSHAMKWVAVAVDLDLNKSKSLGFDSETQYLGLGAELNVFDMSTVRIGYRSNLSDASTSVATVGFGMKIYGVQFDLAAGANEDEIDLAASAAYRF